MIPFQSKLLIKDDETFEYLGGACTASFYSKGIWKEVKDTLILKSLKTNKCYWKDYFGEICMTREEIEKNSDDNKTIKDCEPIGEESYVIFKNEKFYIRNDTLIYIGKDKDCPDLRIAFSIKEKVRMHR